MNQVVGPGSLTLGSAFSGDKTVNDFPLSHSRTLSVIFADVEMLRDSAIFVFSLGSWSFATDSSPSGALDNAWNTGQEVPCNYQVHEVDRCWMSVLCDSEFIYCRETSASSPSQVRPGDGQC